MPANWNFYKVYLKRIDLTRQEKRAELLRRFKSGARTPKLARGRRHNPKTGKSERSSVDVRELNDYAEFIYDFESCVLALRRRDPILPNSVTLRAIRSLLAREISENYNESDVHTELLRDTTPIEALFNSNRNLTRIKIKAARPNPGPSRDALNQINIGLILDESGGDEIKFEERRTSPGSLDKSPNGFIRTSVVDLTRRGYLESGEATFDSTPYDLKRESTITSRPTRYDGRNEAGIEEEFDDQVLAWFEELDRRNSDNYAIVGDEKK